MRTFLLSFLVFLFLLYSSLLLFLFVRVALFVIVRRLTLFFFFRGMGASTCHPLSRSSTPTRNVRSVVSPRLSEVCVAGFTGQEIPSPRRTCTPSGKAFRSLGTRSRFVEKPSPQYSLTNWSVNFLPHARWAYFTKNVAVKNVLKLTASVCLLHLDDTPLEVCQNHAPPRCRCLSSGVPPLLFSGSPPAVGRLRKHRSPTPPLPQR